MPVYEVTSPDGKTWEVTAPEGASQEQVLAFARQNWKAPEPPKKPQSVADEVGPVKAGVIAAGRSTDKILAGARQMLANLFGDQQALDKLAAEQAENDRLYKPLREANPIATSIGEAAPALAVPVGGAGAGMILRSAGAGALPGLLSYGSVDERIKSGAIGAAGGAAGGAIGYGIGKALKPADTAGAISREAMDAAERLGLKLTAGQRTQNPALLNFENYLARSPGSSGAMQARQAANQTAMNTAAAKAMGQATGSLDEGAFATARNAIGNEFQRLEALTSPQLGGGFFKALTDIDSANMARGAFRSKSIDSLVEKGLDLAAKNNLSGTAYKEIRTELSNKANEAFKGGDATLGQAYKTLRDALDDAAKQSLSKADQKAWDVAREQWAAFKTLTKSNVSEAGNVSPARVASALRQRGDQFRTGRMDGELADLGRIGEAVKSAQNPNSGVLMNQMMYGNPLTGLPLMAGNKAIQSMYLSRPVQAYLANGLLDIGDAGAIAVGKLAQPLGAPVAQSLLGTR